MNFIYQKDFNRSMDEQMVELERVCHDLDINFVPIIVTPFEHSVNDEQIENLSGSTVFYGSNVMEEVSQRYPYKPGWFHIPQDEISTYKYFGDYYINHDMLVCRTDNYLQSLKEYGLYDHDYYFMKPNDAKYFPGTIVDKPMMPFVIESQGKHFGTPDVYDLCISPVKKILSEWRFFIVDNKIVTGSKYHAENLRLDIQKGYKKEAFNFASRMNKKVEDISTYVLDIALMEDNKYKVVEINCLNSSGLYAINTYELMKELKNFVARFEN